MQVPLSLPLISLSPPGYYECLFGSSSGSWLYGGALTSEKELIYLLWEEVNVLLWNISDLEKEIILKRTFMFPSLSFNSPRFVADLILYIHISTHFPLILKRIPEIISLCH